jgi:hypothetical protein
VTTGAAFTGALAGTFDATLFAGADFDAAAAGLAGAAFDVGGGAFGAVCRAAGLLTGAAAFDGAAFTAGFLAAMIELLS